jgi:hypothetical protein|tara:strand:- start:243 stop:437 length:195 start_codon:yes stop_codon:yes gene_type:complete
MDLIMSIIKIFMDNFKVVLEVIGIAAAIAVVTPNKADDKVVQMILNAVNFLGGNFGKSTNHPDA